MITMYESALTPVTLTTYTSGINSGSNAVITDSVEATRIGRTKRPIFWISCTGTGLSGKITLTYMGKVADLDYAQSIDVDVTLMQVGSSNVYIGSVAFDCDYDDIKLTKITNGAGATASNFVIKLSGVARGV